MGGTFQLVLKAVLQIGRNMQDWAQPSAKEVASARAQNKLLRDTLTRLKASQAGKGHTGHLQEDLRRLLDLVTEERVLMERLEVELAGKQGKYEQLLTTTVASVKATLRATTRPGSTLLLQIDRENAEIEEFRRKLQSEVHSAAETLNQLKVTELEQAAELSLNPGRSTPRPIPTLHKSGARLNEVHRSPVLKPLDSRR